MYNYLESVKAAVRRYLEEEAPEIDREDLFYNRETLENDLNDNLWINDSVTGNASGSYTFNRCKAKENVMDNMDLVQEVVREFCIDAETVAEKFLSEDWEYFDVSIRCYLLGQAISEVLDEIEEELEAEEV